MKIPKSIVLAFRGEGVYVFWNLNTCLYVGQSKCVVGRMRDGGHYSLERALKQFTHADIVGVGLKSKERFALESSLIRQLAPKYNKKVEGFLGSKLKRADLEWLQGISSTALHAEGRKK